MLLRHLKKINANSNKYSPIRLNQVWLSWVVKFFETKQDIKNEWYDSASPNVAGMITILSHIKRYNSKDPLHVGRELNSLYEAFLEKADKQDKRYERERVELAQAQLTAEEIKRAHPIAEPKKLNFDDPQLNKLRNSVGLILKKLPHYPTKEEKTSVNLLAELPFSECMDLSFLNRNFLRFKKPAVTNTGTDKPTQKLFVELQASKKFKQQKSVADDVDVPKLRCR